MKIDPDNTPDDLPRDETVAPTRTGGIYSPNWRGSAWIIGAIGIGIAIGGTGVALAAMPGGGWGHGPRLAMVQQVVHRALDSVGATTTQEDKVHDIVAATFTDLDRDAGIREAVRKQVLDLLRAPTIDRAAVEKLRAEQIARFDAVSKKVVGAVLDAADQLTPDQRTKLAERVAEGPRRGPWGRDPAGGPAHFDDERTLLGHDHPIDDPE